MRGGLEIDVKFKGSNARRDGERKQKRTAGG